MTTRDKDAALFRDAVERMAVSKLVGHINTPVPHAALRRLLRLAGYKGGWKRGKGKRDEA